MTDDLPLISMVTATCGRSAELRRLVASLSAQTAGGFELIVVDQNRDARVAEALASHDGGFPVSHIRIAPEGVCHARNAGARAARGEWLLFPDDDCWYPDDFVATLRAVMARTPKDLYAGRAVDSAGRTIMGAFPDRPTPLTRETAWRTLIEWLTLFRADTFAEAGGFDPRIGPGAGSPWGGYEIQDIVLRCLANGAEGLYDPALRGHHPEDRSERGSPEDVAKMRRYSQGKGFVMRRHGFALHRFLPEVLRPMAGMFFYAATLRFALARRSAALWRGAIYGWRHSAPSETERLAGGRDTVALVNRR